jgi:cytochrome d ubiquinol oxidase subunit II
MIPVWYGVVSFMLIAYIVLDGRNFGAGMLHWFVAKTPEERRQVVAAIGPLWSWHEVWLVAFGGTLIATFPKLMATAFSGYYLALFLILWCLLLRAMALEVGGHINDMAFFTNFNIYGNVGILDWYTISIALFSAVMLAAHGATYLTLKTEGPVHDRSARYARRLWVLVVPLLIIVSIETWFVRPNLLTNGVNPMFWASLLVVAVSAFAIFSGIEQNHEMRAFIGSSFLVIGMLATGASAIFPVMLFSTLAPENSLTADAVAANPGSLMMASMWWPIAFVLAATYFIFISRRYYGKVSVNRDTQGYY